MAYSVAYVTAKIQGIDIKQGNYQTAKSDLQAVKTKCQNKITRLQNTNKKIDSGTKLGKVKMENNFEGEMATSLAKRVADFYDDGKEVITNAEAIVTAIDAQITKLETENANLSTERKQWVRELETATA